MADFNYQRDHSRAMYNLKGQIFWCHSKDDEARAKEQGFTNPNYVRSEWPKAAYHKKTGEMKSVGKLEWTAEQNAKALADLGSEWTLDHVATPEPSVKATHEIEGGQLTRKDLDAFATISADVKLLVKRIEELEEAAIQSDSVRMSLETRIIELENAVSTPDVSGPTIDQTEQQEQNKKKK